MLSAPSSATGSRLARAWRVLIIALRLAEARRWIKATGPIRLTQLSCLLKLGALSCVQYVLCDTLLMLSPVLRLIMQSQKRSFRLVTKGLSLSTFYPTENLWNHAILKFYRSSCKLEWPSKKNLLPSAPHTLWITQHHPQAALLNVTREAICHNRQPKEQSKLRRGDTTKLRGWLRVKKLLERQPSMRMRDNFHCSVCVVLYNL